MKNNNRFGTKRHFFDSVIGTGKMQISVSIGTSCHKGTNFAFIKDKKYHLRPIKIYNCIPIEIRGNSGYIVHTCICVTDVNMKAFVTPRAMW